MKIELAHPASALEALIPVNEPAQAQLDGRRFPTAIRGVASPRWVFLDIPKSKGKLIPVSKQQMLSLRYIHQGIVYGFKTSISGVYITPYQILVLHFPKSIERKDLRRSERIKTFIPVWVQMEENPAQKEAAIVDISREGALVSMDLMAPPEEGAELAVTLTLPDGKRIEALGCVVRNMRRPKAAILMGVDFAADTTGQLAWLQRFYDECACPEE